MDVLMPTGERTQELLGADAGMSDSHCLDGDARQAADARLALVAQGGPWPGRAEQLGRRAKLVAKAAQASGDA